MNALSFLRLEAVRQASNKVCLLYIVHSIWRFYYSCLHEAEIKYQVESVGLNTIYMRLPEASNQLKVVTALRA